LVDLGFAAEGGFPGRHRHRGVDVRALDLEARVRRDLDLQQEVAGLAAVEAGLPLAGEADLLARPDPLGDAHRQRLALAGRRVRESDLPRAAADRFVQAQGDLRLGVSAPAAAERIARTERAARAVEGTAAAARAPPARGTASEQHFEERAEPLAAAHAAEIESLPAEPLPAVALPTGRHAAGALPVGTELVVLLALVRVLEDLIGLADLLELELRLRLLVDVRMKLARLLAVSLLDLILRGVLLDTQRGVVVLVVQSSPPPRAPRCRHPGALRPCTRHLGLSAWHSHCRTERGVRPFQGSRKV
jgi:hypothetical protein